MKNNPNGWSENRSLCEWTYCNARRWAPYSWSYCALHFAVAALEIDRERKEQDLPPYATAWARDRFCGVLNGYTANLGDVSWDTNYPREELLRIGTEYLDLEVNETKEVQWRQARAATAARHGKQWPNSRRHVPEDYDGPGSRIAISRTQAINKIEVSLGDPGRRDR